MATTVSDIITQVKSIAAAELGATYQELRYVYDVSGNDIRAGKLAYGVRPLEAETVAGVTREYTLNHRFELILTDTIARANSDEDAQAALGTMYNKADEIFRDMVKSKINLASVVLGVFEPSMSEPEFFNEQKLVVLRMQFTVRYRAALNL